MSTSLTLLAALVSLTPAPRRVASIELVHPYGEADRFARYVDLTPGQPFRAADLRQAIRLLYATGEFADVLVQGSERPDGVALRFELQPAPQLAEIRVEGDPVLSPRRARRVTGLRPGEPLWHERLDRAARDAALALVDEGYLEARVSAAAVPGPGGADALFSVEAGPRVRVSRVSLEAATLDPVPRQRLRGLAEPTPGAVFRRSAAREAGLAMRDALREIGRWRARVEVREAYDPLHERVALEYAVDPGPQMMVEVEGAELPRSLRRRVERQLAAGGAASDVLAGMSDEIEEHYRGRGYREALVSSSERRRERGLAIVFDVERGPLWHVASLRVVGSTDGRLEQLIPLELRGGQPLRDELLTQTTTRLQRELNERGHPEALVEAEVPDGGGSVRVVLRVDEGPRVVVRDVVLEGVREDVPVPPLAPRVGEPYRTRDVAAARDALLAAYRDAGFLVVEVVPEVRHGEERTEATVAFTVAPGPRTRIDRIVIAGLDLTREEVVRRELLFEEGGPLGPQRLLESQRRLSVLGIFSQVTIRQLDPEASERRSVLVSVQEAPRTVLSYGLGYSERDLLRASVEVTRRNLFGAARSASAFARIGFRGSRFLVTFREPYLLGRRHELFVTGFREEEDREGFDFERFGGLLQTARNLTPRLSLIGRYSYRQARSFNIQEGIEVDREFQNSTFSGPSASLILDSRDDPLEPTHGAFLGSDAQISLAALGGDSYVKGFVQLAVYRTLLRDVRLALSGRVGLSASYGGAPAQLPLPERFFAGGAYSLRGYSIDGVDPAGGNALLLGSVELRIPLRGSLSVGVFTDVGNTYPTVSALDFGDLRYSAGLGLRYSSPFGPLRVDWGYKLDARVDESRYRFHFAIGHVF